MPWEARGGRCSLWFDETYFSNLKAADTLVGALRGSFDGGRSEHGVGARWVIDECLITSTSPCFDSSGSISTWRRVASESFLLSPTSAIACAELLACQRLLAVGI
eukprot:3081385-Pyramimonas_sp.AAC.1